MLKVIFLTSNKSGVLSKISTKCLKFGLSYKGNESKKVNSVNTLRVVSFEGSINDSHEAFSAEMESYSEIHKVEHISLPSSNNLNSSNVSPDLLTTENIVKAELLLTEILGPISSIVIKSTIEKTQYTDEFYLLLSEELEVEDRQKFIEAVRK